MNDTKYKGFDLGTLRAVREDLEEKMLADAPRAHCLDGRMFEYETSLASPLAIGTHVELNTRDRRTYLGQILTRELSVAEGPEYGMEVEIKETKGVFGAKASSSQLRDTLKIRHIRGTGLLLGIVGPDGKIKATSRKNTFVDAELGEARENVVSHYLAWEDSEYGTLPVGSSLLANGDVRVSLKADGFTRHTFMCGQSGSGKTFALGVLIEQLLYQTDLRLIILDLNSDFINVDRVKGRDDINKSLPQPMKLSDSEYEALRQKHSVAVGSCRILRPVKGATGGTDMLRLRFSDLEIFEQARILGLDPIGDRQEFHTFTEIVRPLRNDYSLLDVNTRSLSDTRPAARELALRIQNMGILGWDMWAKNAQESVLRVLQSRPRCTVLDLGTFSPVEKSVFSGAILGHIWRCRNEKEPILLIVEEAHNVCPQAASFGLQSIPSDYVVRIAGEGRKYCIHMLLVTQQPGKIHAHVISQCENLILMKMNDSASLKYISDVFSQVPASLVNQGGGFGQGEALISGRIVRSPTFVKFEGRATQEGGQDVPPIWAARR